MRFPPLSFDSWGNVLVSYQRYILSEMDSAISMTTAASSKANRMQVEKEETVVSVVCFRSLSQPLLPLRRSTTRCRVTKDRVLEQTLRWRALILFWRIIRNWSGQRSMVSRKHLFVSVLGWKTRRLYCVVWKLP